MANTKRKVSISRCMVNGKRMWRVRRWENGKPKRSFFGTKSEADSAASDLREQAASVGASWLNLTGRQRHDVLTLNAAMEERGLSVAQVMDIIKNAPAAKSPKLSEVIDQYIAAKEKAGRDDGYTANVRIILNGFAKGIESKSIRDISLDDIEKYLDSNSLAYRATLRGRISGLIKFSIRREYRLDNPCLRLESVKHAKPIPQIFTPDQFTKLLNRMLEKEKSLLAWFVLSTACGFRPEEAEKTDPKRDINFKEGFVKVEAQTTKVRQRRVVYPVPEALKLLKWAIKKGGKLPIGKSWRLALLRKARTVVGFAKWPKDITRHTAASWLLAAGVSKAKVAEMLGNSEGILKRDYDARMTRVDAKEFTKAILQFV